MGTDMDAGNTGGGLLRQFVSVTNSSSHTSSIWRTPFLVLNGSIPEDDEWLGGNISNDGAFRFQEAGSRVLASKLQGKDNISVSLCYTAWATARLDVQLGSDKNRSEPIAHWKNGTGLYSTPDINHQMGCQKTGSPLDISRGTLSLAAKKSWIPTPEDALLSEYIQPFGQIFADIFDTTGVMENDRLIGNWTAVLTDPSYVPGDFSDYVVVPDAAITSLFYGLMAKSGSLGRSLSSLITVLSSMAYYDQMPYFQQSSNTSLVFFTTVLFPHSRHGSWTIIMILSTHVALISVVVAAFVLHSKYTLLGNYWQSIAQLCSRDTERLMLTSGTLMDKAIKDRLKKVGDEQSTAGVGPLEEDSERAGVVKNGLRRRSGKS